MAKEFSFSENISSILWKETLWHNALRAVGAGVAWCLIMAVAGTAGNPLTMLIGMPAAYFIVLLPVGLVAGWLSSVPFVGLFAAFIAFLVAVGDPLVFALNKARPDWVPVERPDIFSLQIITFVLSPFEE